MGEVVIKGEPSGQGRVLARRDLDRHHPGLDVLSRRIIGMLQVDGRRSVASMARELGLPHDVVGARFQSLLDSGVVFVAAVSDPVRLGFEAQAMLGIVTEPGMAQAVAEELAARQEFVYVLLTSGSFDVMAEVYADDAAHLARLVAGLEELPGVTSAQRYPYSLLEKLIYTWDPD